MKFTIDTTNKIITLLELVQLGELFEEISKMLPDPIWKEYKIEQQYYFNPNTITIPNVGTGQVQPYKTWTTN